MSILLIAGSPTQPSRSTALLSAVAARLQAQGLSTEPLLQLMQLDSEALLHARFDHPEIRSVSERVARADAVVVATPVYKAAYSGLLKVFLDVLPQTAFRASACCPWPERQPSPHAGAGLCAASRAAVAGCQPYFARHLCHRSKPAAVTGGRLWPGPDIAQRVTTPSSCWRPTCAVPRNGLPRTSSKTSRLPMCDVASRQEPAGRQGRPGLARWPMDWANPIFQSLCFDSSLRTVMAALRLKSGLDQL